MAGLVAGAVFVRRHRMLAEPVAARTWFQAVQPGTNRARRIAPSALPPSTAANALFRGTLQAIVTSTLPTR